MRGLPHLFSFFFFNDTAPTEIYTLSLHDALPISLAWPAAASAYAPVGSPPALTQHNSKIVQIQRAPRHARASLPAFRWEEHTSELQSHLNLVCRLLLEKKKTTRTSDHLRSRMAHP